MQGSNAEIQRRLRYAIRCIHPPVVWSRLILVNELLYDYVFSLVPQLRMGSRACLCSFLPPTSRFAVPGIVTRTPDPNIGLWIQVVAGCLVAVVCWLVHRRNTFDKSSIATTNWERPTFLRPPFNRRESFSNVAQIQAPLQCYYPGDLIHSPEVRTSAEYPDYSVL